MRSDPGEVRALIVDDGAESPGALLSRALEAGGLWDLLADACRRLSRTSSDLRVAIKPDLSAFEAGSPAATDPRLVEALIDSLHDRGFVQVAVVASADSSSIWAENRTPLALADLLGYRFTTPRKRAYDILDPADDPVAADAPPGSLLQASPLSRPWLEADVRILFSKNKTDEADGFALTLDSLLGVLALDDKDYYYRQRFDPGLVVLELLALAPPHFALIDAIVSCHGSGGTRAPQPVRTGTLIASPSAPLIDFVGALKMGVDPNVSRVARTVLKSLGLPKRYRIDGNLAVYEGWRPVHPVVVDAVRARDKWVSVSRTMKPWLQQTDPVNFPLKDPVNTQINRALAGRLGNIDEDDSAFALYVAANYGVGLIYECLEAYQVLNAKDALRRRHVPLGIDPASFELAEYETADYELEQLRALLSGYPRDANGLRWRYVGEAVIFEFAHRFPVPFDEFVAAIDIAKTIQFMNDYSGGVVVPVVTDEQGRVTHQAERNLYLPQPNYLVLSKGDVIDVTKLEHVTYADREYKMAWRTIKSENRSADYDDGVVTFSRSGNGTTVNIFGRQLFTLPPFWRAVNLDLVPALKNELVSHAYTTFLQRTFSNFEALLEGRDIAIGKAWHVPADRSATEPLLNDTVAERVTTLIERHGPAIGRALGRAATEDPAHVDSLGFAHFRGGSTGRPGAKPIPEEPADSFARGWAEFWVQLAAAAARDFEALGRQQAIK